MAKNDNLIKEILASKDLGLLLLLQQDLEIRSRALSQKSGIPATEFSRMKALASGDNPKGYKLSNLERLKEMICLILVAVKEKDPNCTFPELEALVSFKDVQIKIKSEAATIVCTGEILVCLYKIGQIFVDSETTEGELLDLAERFLEAENLEDILSLIEAYKKVCKNAGILDILKILDVPK